MKKVAFVKGITGQGGFYLAREVYGMSVANGILFNHESPNSGGVFVTQKIAKFAV